MKKEEWPRTRELETRVEIKFTQRAWNEVCRKRKGERNFCAKIEILRDEGRAGQKKRQRWKRMKKKGRNWDTRKIKKRWKRTNKSGEREKTGTRKLNFWSIKLNCRENGSNYGGVPSSARTGSRCLIAEAAWFTFLINHISQREMGGSDVPSCRGTKNFPKSMSQL